MRVLRNAHETPWWKGEFACNGCDSELLVEKYDLTYVSDNRDGDAYKFTCPVCKKENWIAATLIPARGRP